MVLTCRLLLQGHVCACTYARALRGEPACSEQLRWLSLHAPDEPLGEGEGVGADQVLRTAELGSALEPSRPWPFQQAALEESVLVPGRDG